MPRTTSAALVAFGLTLLAASTLDGERMPSSLDTAAAQPLAKLPVDFVENRGQWDGPSVFVARHGRLAASLEQRAIRLMLSDDRQARVSLTFEGASLEAILSGE